MFLGPIIAAPGDRLLIAVSVLSLPHILQSLLDCWCLAVNRFVITSPEQGACILHRGVHVFFIFCLKLFCNSLCHYGEQLYISLLIDLNEIIRPLSNRHILCSIENNSDGPTSVYCNDLSDTPFRPLIMSNSFTFIKYRHLCRLPENWWANTTDIISLKLIKSLIVYQIGTI